MGVSSLPKTATRQRRGCDLNPGPSAPESSPLPQLGYRATRWPLQPPVKRKSSLRPVPRGCHDERRINTRRPAAAAQPARRSDQWTFYRARAINTAFDARLVRRRQVFVSSKQRKHTRGVFILPSSAADAAHHAVSQSATVLRRAIEPPAVL